MAKPAAEHAPTTAPFGVAGFVDPVARCLIQLDISSTHGYFSKRKPRRSSLDQNPAGEVRDGNRDGVS